jgi:hypothetical protein
MRSKYAAFGALAIVLAVAAFGFYRYWEEFGPLPVSFPTADQRFIKPFLDERIPSREDYDGMVEYFQDGLVTYRESNRALVRYPGLPSNHGPLRERVEGFARVAPLLAVWLRNNPTSDTLRAKQAREILVDGITNGTDPESPGYWGQMHDFDQLFVEASDIALTLWLLRDSIWPQLSLQTRNHAVQWLLQVNGKNVPDSNWRLFVIYVNLVVDSFGYRSDMKNARDNYDRFKQFYRGDGWFSDGPGNQFDYYNAWGMHYQLFWIDQVKPTWDHDFITKALDDFAGSFQYLIGPEGYPVRGRSICYRFAISSPLILDQRLPNPSVRAGVARRALDMTWRYFTRNGGISNGNMTQGYCGADSRVLDPYIGPASCLWGLRSLISALYLDSSSAFWTQPDELLPVERSNYQIEIPVTGWTVIGIKPDVITIESRSGSSPARLVKREKSILAFYDRWTGTSHRGEMYDLKYYLREYRSDRPICDCVAPH